MHFQIVSSFSVSATKTFISPHLIIVNVYATVCHCVQSCVAHEVLPLVFIVSYCNSNGCKMQDMIIDVIILLQLK